MMRTSGRLLAAALCVLGLAAAGACARGGRTAPVTAEPAPPVPGYVLVWRDEFSGAALDTARWTAYAGARRGAQNDPGAAGVARGVLTLATWTANGAHHTGFVDTAGKFAATYGYFEARVRFASSPGEWGAFWLQSPTMGSPPDDVAVAGAEVDVVEHRATDGDGREIATRYGINVHWDGYGADHKHAGGRGAMAAGAAPLQGDWHTYAVLWTPDRYTFFLDGVEQWSTRAGVSRRPEYIRLTCEVQDASWAGHVPAGGYRRREESRTRMQVDWVRVWQSAP
jgi:beta-glucanase (GH16 family)